MTEKYSRPDPLEFARLLEWAKRNPPGPQERHEQAISWARGELRLQHPEMTWQEADNRARNACRRLTLKETSNG